LKLLFQSWYILAYFGQKSQRIRGEDVSLAQFKIGIADTSTPDTTEAKKSILNTKRLSEESL